MLFLDDPADRQDRIAGRVRLRREGQEAGAVAQPRAVIGAVGAVVAGVPQALDGRREGRLRPASIAEKRERRRDLAPREGVLKEAIWVSAR